MNLSSIRALLPALPERHRRALEWFDEQAGRTVGWPGRLDDGTLLATKAKGIYKPEWSKYALSVRQSLTGPYPDRSVESHEDGSWTYEYFQEALDDSFVERFTNRGLNECMVDVVPVGVFIQTGLKPNPRYRILGLALVTSFDSGYFRLDGAAAQLVLEQPSGIQTADAFHPQARADFIAGRFDPFAVEDARQKELRTVVVRQGQPGFRKLLLAAYDRRCAITTYDAEDSLEAAHIVPYRGAVTNHPSNGLLLRADLHTLFDLRLIAIDFNERRLLMTPELAATRYSSLSGQHIAFPGDSRLHPSKAAVDWQRGECGL